MRLVLQGSTGEIVAEAMACGAVGFSTSFAPTHMGAKGLPVLSRPAGAYPGRMVP